MLREEPYYSNIVVVDEAHCVKKWYILTLEKSKLVQDECMLKFFYRGDTFRREFAR